MCAHARTHRSREKEGGGSGSDNVCGRCARGSFLTCWTRRQRGINIGWGLLWLSIGALLMAVSQLLIRKLVLSRNFDLVDYIAKKG